MKCFLKLGIKVGISITLCVVLIRKFNISFDLAYNGVVDVSWGVVAAIISVTVIPLITVNRWRLFLRMCGVEESFWPLWRIILISCFQGLVLPSTQGFDVLRMCHIKRRHPMSFGGAVGSVIIERMIGLLIFCSLAVIGLPLVSPHVAVKWPIVLGVVGFSIAALVAVLLVINKKIYALYSNWRPDGAIFKKVVGLGVSIHSTLVNFPYRKVMVSSIVLILIFQLFTISSVYLLFMAYGISLPFYMHMAFYPVIAIIAMMPVTIGGFGVREGAFAYFYSLVGVPAETSVCVSVANYVVLSLLPAALGGVIWLFDCLHGKK